MCSWLRPSRAALMAFCLLEFQVPFLAGGGQIFRARANELFFHDNVLKAIKGSALKDISEKVVKTSLIHSYSTRGASCGKYHIQLIFTLNQQRNSFSCFGAKAWNCLSSEVCNVPKLPFKKSIRQALFTALASEEDHIEAPNLLSKTNLYFT